ncbi:hypothetical protein KKE78_01565 [Patescibacteria group bacterium]|nr:hypothetical protein [Patescibacteria group bacterium]
MATNKLTRILLDENTTFGDILKKIARELFSASNERNGNNRYSQVAAEHLPHF